MERKQKLPRQQSQINFHRIHGTAKQTTGWKLCEMWKESTHRLTPEEILHDKSKWNNCGISSHMTKFCVRKAKRTEGRVYAMQYDESSEGSDDEEDANLIETRPGDGWSTENEEVNDEENSDDEDVNNIKETSNDESESEEDDTDTEHIRTLLTEFSHSIQIHKVNINDNSNTDSDGEEIIERKQTKKNKDIP